MTGTYGAIWLTRTGSEREGDNCDTLEDAIATIPSSATSWRVMSWEKRGATWGAYQVASSA